MDKLHQDKEYCVQARLQLKGQRLQGQPAVKRTKTGGQAVPSPSFVAAGAAEFLPTPAVLLHNKQQIATQPKDGCNSRFKMSCITFS